MRKGFSTPIETEIADAFKAYCKQNGLQMNDVLEQLMKAIVEGKIKLKTEVSFELK